ncbi:hypothetical protein NIES39_E01640 [Arthrospira platensis NIES-39]|nr:hypothetical protein NIES39_E01640 [Arthrospira platensis NIES-39]
MHEFFAKKRSLFFQLLTKTPLCAFPLSPQRASLLILSPPGEELAEPAETERAGGFINLLVVRLINSRTCRNREGGRVY